MRDVAAFVTWPAIMGGGLLKGQAMGLKKAELYRGFNIFTEEVRAGA